MLLYSSHRQGGDACNLRVQWCCSYSTNRKHTSKPKHVAPLSVAVVVRCSLQCALERPAAGVRLSSVEPPRHSVFFGFEEGAYDVARVCLRFVLSFLQCTRRC